MYCTGCGKKIAEGNNVCTECGAPVKESRKKGTSKKFSDKKAAPAGAHKPASGSYMYLYRDDKKYGPYSLDDLIQYARQGNIGPDDMIYSEKEDSRKRADQIPAIADIFSKDFSTSGTAKTISDQHKGKRLALILGLAGGSLIIFLGLAVFLVFRFLSISGIYAPEGTYAWNYQSTIAKPIIMEAGTDDIIMGDFSKHGLTVQIPKGSFDQKTQVTLSHPDHTLYMDSDGLSALGVPLKVEIEGQQKRLSEPAIIIIGFDSKGIKEKGEVFAAYYHDLYGWELFRPEMVDLERGIMGFSTYHFSDFCAVQADEERRIKEFVKKKSVDEFVRDCSGEQTTQVVERMVKELLKESLNIPPENKIAQIIIRAVIEEIPGGKYGLAIYDGKPEDFTNEVLSKTFEHISYNGDSLEELGVEAGPIAAMSRAAASFSEGEYEDALKHLSEGIADSVPAVKKFKKVGETTIKVTRHIRDDLYLEAERMKAFDVYKNGSDTRAYGYNVDAGDWDALVSQGHGYFSRFSEEELAVLKQNFDKRIERWEEIERIEAANKAFIELMQQKGYLSYGGNPMISEKGDEDLEMLLNRLFRISERIRAESGRYEIVIRPDDFEAAGHSKEDDNLILAEHLAILIDTYYTEGQEAYVDKMIELGLIQEQDTGEEKEVIVAEQQPEPVYEKEPEDPPLVDYAPEDDYYETEGGVAEEEQVVYMNLDGIWDRSNGEVIKIQGSTGVFLSFSSAWGPAVDAGFISVGSTKWVNIVQTGENQWVCNNLWYFHVDNKPHSVGWCDGSTTISMSSDGQSITVKSTAVHPYDGTILKADPTYRRQ